MTFPSQPAKPDFWKLQERVNAFWKEYNTFERSIEQRPENNPYRFYDGPPFITGLPHYGSLLSSICKDVIPRYQTMKGKRVERVRGWDCHGIPIEEKVQKEMNLSNKFDIEKVGIDKFIEGCYSYTRSNSAEWKRYIDAIGRWVDMDNSYKTMDNSYMESVWRVFKTIYEKGLMYEGKRVSMYSTKLSTPISNFEVAMDNSYDNVNDPAITVKFELKTDAEKDNLPDGYEIVLANTHDVEEVITVRDECRYETYINESKNITQKTLENHLGSKKTSNITKLKQWLEEGKKLYLLKYKGVIVGIKYWPYQDKNNQKWRVGGIYIKSAHQGKGLGTQLMDVALNQHNDKEIWLTIADYNQGAQRFYEKLGFSVSTENAPVMTFDNGSELQEVWMKRKPLIEKNGKTYILAWTTTPWTIPANMALGVHTDINYVKLEFEGNYYVLARDRVEDFFKEDQNFSLVEEFTGDRLIGLKYTPPFDYFTEKFKNDKNHTILFADFATAESGTGIVHQAPEFGEDDFNLGMKEGVSITEAMDDLGRYTDQIHDHEGLFYRDANPVMIEKLEAKGLLFKKASITHRVAFCPRTGIPLVYKAQNSWFINIQDSKQNLLAQNEKINRYPNHFKHGRFAHSLETAPDWCISRTRFWGTPMPVYRQKNNDGLYTQDETLVIGSRDELFEYNKSFKQLTRIIFVRHGNTNYNEKEHGDDYSNNKAQLNEIGKAQSLKVANELANTHISAVYCSPMHRCVEMIEPLLANKGMEAIIDTRLREIDMPANNDKKFNADKRVWNDEPVDGGEGESLPQLHDRVSNFLEDIIHRHPGETIVVCSHGEPLTMMRKVFEDFEYMAERKKYRISNNNPDEAPMQKEFVFSETMKKLDMHRPYIDHVRVLSPNTGKELFRIPEVIDNWMDAASMPYGQGHYPFENKAKMEASFPADYIVEYTGQIRAWFYVMHVLGVALFDKPAYTNVLCTGVMQGNDGRKMSKSYGNYPDPRESFKKYGGDAIRMQSLNSPVVYGGDVAVKEESFLEIVKKVLLPLWNTFYFFTTYANIDGFDLSKADHKRENILDQWIMSELHKLIKEVEESLDEYNMQAASMPIVKFLDNMTNRYIRRSRRRFWKSESDADKMQAYTTLYHVLTTLSQVAAPFMPFISEHIFKTLKANGLDDGIWKDELSVHLTDFPVADSGLINDELSKTMSTVQEVIRIGLGWRSTRNIRVRQPLPSITIGINVDKYFQDIIADELNVKQVIIDPAINDTVTKICMPNGRLIGPKFGKDVKEILTQAKSGNFVEHDDGTVNVGHFKLEADEYEISYIKKDITLDIEVDKGIVVVMDGTITPELKREGYARDIVRHIQEMRKEAGYDIADRINVSFSGEDSQFIADLVSNFGEYMKEETLSSIVDDMKNIDLEKEIILEDGPKSGDKIFKGLTGFVEGSAPSLKLLISIGK